MKLKKNKLNKVKKDYLQLNLFQTNVEFFKLMIEYEYEEAKKKP